MERPDHLLMSLDPSRICLPEVRKLFVALWWRSSCAYGRIVSPISGLIIRRHLLMDSRCG